MHLVCNVEQNMDADLLEKGSLQKKKKNEKKISDFFTPSHPLKCGKISPTPHPIQ